MINRSAGTVVTVGSISYIVGGGYEGKTKELDDTVKKVSELLSKTFKRDVEIRFNSDRKSGGAWLVNSLKGFDGNCQIGLCAGIYPEPTQMRAIHEKMFSHQLDWKDGDKQVNALPKVLLVHSYIAASALKNPELATEGTSNSHYEYKLHSSLESAIAYIKASIVRSKILD